MSDPANYPEDLPTPVEVVRAELDSATRALAALSAPLEVLASRTDGDVARLVEKAGQSRRNLAQLIGQVTATVEVLERKPLAAEAMAEDLLDMAHSLAEDADHARGLADFLQLAADNPDYAVEVCDGTREGALWAALLGRKNRSLSLHHARRVHARAVRLARGCRPPSVVTQRRTAEAGLRCRLPRSTTRSATSDDPSPAGWQGALVGNPISRTWHYYSERLGAPH